MLTNQVITEHATIAVYDCNNNNNMTVTLLHIILVAIVARLLPSEHRGIWFSGLTKLRRWFIYNASYVISLEYFPWNENLIEIIFHKII